MHVHAILTIMRHGMHGAFHRLLNLLIEFEGFARVVGELQIHYRPILELKVRSRRSS